MPNEQKPSDNGQDRGIARTILHAQLSPAGIKLLELLLVIASLFLAIRSLMEVIYEDAAQWYDLTVIASIFVAVVATGLYLYARFPGESRGAMWKRLTILGVAVLLCTWLAQSY